LNNTEKVSTKMWRILYPMLTFYGINLIVSSIVSVMIVMGNISGEMMNMVYSGNLTGLLTEYYNLIMPYNALITAIVAACMIPVMWAFMRGDVKREYRLGIHRTYDGISLMGYIYILFLGVAACLFVSNLVSISGLYDSFSQQTKIMTDRMWQGGLALELVGYGILVPIAEELTFRGLIMKRMAEYSNQKLAIFFSSLIFAFYHQNVPQGVYAFLVGLVLCYVYDRAKTIKAPIVLHAGANIISTLANETGFLNNLTSDETGRVIYIVGSALFTLAMLWLVQVNVDPEVLIPSAEDKQGDIQNQIP